MINNLQQVFAAFDPPILFAYIFGSTGTPSQTRQSDLDIAVYFNNKSSEIEISHKAALYSAISRTVKRNDIDIVVLNTCTNQMLLYELMIRGRLIYDADPETRMLFEQKTLHAAIDFKEHRERLLA